MTRSILRHGKARPTILALWMLQFFMMGCGSQPAPVTGIMVESDGAYHVRSGGDIQQALNAAAIDPENKTVVVHSGTYRPQVHGQTFLRFNREHDGISLIADGEVTLTAANPSVADPTLDSYPAIVNHVLYFGHGISDRTELRGFTITGSNGFVMDSPNAPSPEPKAELYGLKKSLFFYCDGGAIKVFGHSYPRLVALTITDNVAMLCGGGISIEQQGYQEDAVTIKDCVFTNNRCPGTGAAVDVLSESSANLENCLFVDNIANTGMDEIAQRWGLTHHEKHGSGALTVFPNTRVSVRRCTFTKNWNGVDDEGQGNIYADSIFWMNTASDGSRPGDPYELDIRDASNVRDCWLRGQINDLRGTLDATANVLDAPDPKFDALYRPRSAEYKAVGYRPVSRE